MGIEQGNESNDGNTRLPYEPPELTVYGTAEDLVQTTASGSSDVPAGPSTI